jgi:hypothetical protein
VSAYQSLPPPLFMAFIAFIFIKNCCCC